jgi:hypothetical protein
MIDEQNKAFAFSWIILVLVLKFVELDPNPLDPLSNMLLQFCKDLLRFV